jgi:hypothetical protein
MSGIFRGILTIVLGASMLFAGCGPKQNDAEVRVSVTDSGSTEPGRDTVINNTTTVIQPPPTVPPPAPDTVIRENTVIERRTDTVVRTVPGETTTTPGPPVSSEERAQIERWLSANSSTLNEYGDPAGTMYTGASPLYNEATGKRTDLYTYVIMKHPDRPWTTMK